MVIREGLLLALVGLGVGVAGAVAAGRLLSHMLYQTSPIDPVTFAGVAVLLTLTAVIACLLPARRASKVEPRVALEGGVRGER